MAWACFPPNYDPHAAQPLRKGMVVLGYDMLPTAQLKPDLYQRKGRKKERGGRKSKGKKKLII